MKIAYYIGSFEAVGGMERVVSLKANWLVAHGYDIHIISFVGGDKTFYSLDERIVVHAMRCVPISGNIIKSYFIDSHKAKCKLKKIIFEERFDILIVAFPYLEGFISSLDDGSKKIYEAHCAKEFSEQLIIRSTHNWGIRKLKLLFQKRKESVLYSRFDKFVTLTERDLKGRCMPENGVVIPNPNTFEISERSELDYKRIITVGRYSVEKGYDYLLQAWKVVEQKHPEWQLDFYGADSGYKEKLKIMSETLGLKSVCFHDSTFSIKQEYLKSSIFVMSSITEGFPMVLTEAMSCGIPCVAFDCATGPAEIITHEQDGILVSKVGDYCSLANAVCLLIENGRMRKLMGEKAQRNVARFSMNLVMKQWVKLFNELCE